jgi:methionyl-tRNA formyltransferase
LDVKFSPIKKKALELGLPVFQPVRLSLEEVERLCSLKPDALVVAAFGQILKRNVLDLPPLGCINIHSSLLPRWRGAAPIHWALLSGDVETGITTMLMAEKLDAGEILLQKKTPIDEEDTVTRLHDRLAQMGAELILPTLEGLQSGQLKGKPQDESQVTLAGKINKEMEWLNPEETAEVLSRRVRALNPWPGTSVRTSFSAGQAIGQRLRVKQVRLRDDILGVKGEIFEQNGRVLLGTSRGSLELLSVQWDGKKEISAHEFLNGLKGRGQSLPLQVGI